MREKIRALLPELNWINDKLLQENVVCCYEDALQVGGWQPQDLEHIPFTLLIPDCPFSYLDHVRGVTRVARAAMEELHSIYPLKNSAFRMDHDTLIAGALLHDIGKLAEYETVGGKTIKSQLGKDLRHPFSGTVIAMRNGCSSRIAHIIANHAAEGDGTLRSPEAVVVNKADFINFETVKSFLGMK